MAQIKENILILFSFVLVFVGVLDVMFKVYLRGYPT